MRALPHVYDLHAYVPGLQPQDSGWVKLNTNENPYPPSPKVAEAIAAEVGQDGARLRLYPEPTSRALRQAIAGTHGLKAENVIAGNGSDDVLNILIRTYCGVEAAAAMCEPSYSLYPVLCAIQNGQLKYLPFTRELKLDVEAAASVEASIFFLTSPNAPTGVGFANKEIQQLLDASKGIVVVDEAYAAFANESAIELLSEYDNLVVTRTFSKSHALAGLRVGYGLASAEIIDLLDRVRDSYNLDRLAQVGAIAAIKDTEYYAGTIAKVIATREALEAKLDERGWFTYPSQANMVFTEPTKNGQSGADVAADCFEYLKANKVLVRYFPKHALTNSFLRITIGTDQEMETLNKVIDKWEKNA